MKVIAKHFVVRHSRLMKEKLWLTFITCFAYCVDKELWKEID